MLTQPEMGFCHANTRAFCKAPFYILTAHRGQRGRVKKGYVYMHVDVCLIISSTRVHSLAKMTLDICDTKFEVWVEEIQTGGSRGKGGGAKGKDKVLWKLGCKLRWRM